ncbi:hypothetical protein B566_EDAN016489, partial [Ephemera danica]
MKMKTMGGNKRKEPIPEDDFELDVVEEDSIDLVIEEVPEKRHKKHKHKRHKKKKAEEEVLVGVATTSSRGEGQRIPKPSLKLKIKLAEAKSIEKSKPKEKSIAPKMVVPERPPAAPVVASPGTGALSPAALKLLAAKKKKGGKGKESGTSSEEERWLDAIESGKLEEVDDELKKIKDPKLMTARQRAMFEKKTEKEPSPGGEQLMALPSGYKEKVVTEEMLQKRALKLQRRKQMAEEKREKDKKKTMDRLLKKQESKAKGAKPARSTKHHTPQITYRSTVNGITISLPAAMEFPLPKMTA